MMGLLSGHPGHKAAKLTQLALAMNVTRRPATGADTPIAREAHHGAYREPVTRQFGRWDEAQQDVFFARDWADAVFEVLEVDGVPCGYACIEERDEDFHVREIVVHPNFQGRGIGTAVLRETQERARARGVPVVLGTFLTNRAVGLYRRLGFRETGSTDIHVLMEWRAGGQTN
jgi:ribosomal protein S18 acetylase RimI-like enzyme